MRDRQGFILVYDITNPASVDDLHDLYAQILRNKLPQSSTDDEDSSSPTTSSPNPSPIVPLVLVGNKLDLAIERKVSHQRGKELSRHWRCPHYETSAKTRTNVDEIFYDLVGQIMVLKEESVRRRGRESSLGEEREGEKDDDFATTECCVIS
jgi:GTPase SAR1 family protein